MKVKDRDLSDLDFEKSFFHKFLRLEPITQTNKKTNKQKQKKRRNKTLLNRHEQPQNKAFESTELNLGRNIEYF